MLLLKYSPFRILKLIEAILPWTHQNSNQMEFQVLRYTGVSCLFLIQVVIFLVLSIYVLCFSRNVSCLGLEHVC